MDQIQIGGRSYRNDGAVVNRASSRFDTLPEDCISMVISHTTPRDACVLASVSKTVKSAAQSDLVWETFLPPEYSSIVPQSLNHSSKKEIYLSLAEDSVLIDDGKKSFWLEKSSGKNCYMVSMMDLKIVRKNSPAYWQWITVPESKFKKVAELLMIRRFEIHGYISCRMLSKRTHYSVYLVFKRASILSHGFNHRPGEAGVGFVGKKATKRYVYFEPEDALGRYHYSCNSMRPWWWPREEVQGEGEIGRSVEEPKERGDGWSEVELGRIYINNGGCEDEVEITIMETQLTHWKSGLIFQGIEIRPLKEEEEVVAKCLSMK